MHLEVVASYFSQRPMKHDDQRDYVHAFGVASKIPTSTCILYPWSLHATMQHGRLHIQESTSPVRFYGGLGTWNSPPRQIYTLAAMHAFGKIASHSI